MWWKKNQWKVIVPVVIAAVLVIAFWFGGNSPGSQGWPTKDPQQTETVQPTPTESNAPEETETLSPEDSTAPAPTDSTAPEESTGGNPNGGKDHSGGTTTNPNDGKDEHQTDPTPSGKPKPVEPEDADITDKTYTCTISISCATILDHMDWLAEEKKDLVPEDGWILKPTTVTFYEGESVFNVLQRTCKQKKIHMEFENTPMYNSAYIEGIHNLYEFDCGEQSGWMYKVNGWFPNYGCSRYQLKDGDTICWVYTCDLGADVGGSNSTGS